MENRLKIPEIRLPTEDELRTSSAAWAEAVGATFIDQWPPELLAISCPTQFVELPQDFVKIFDSEDYFNQHAREIADQVDNLTGFSDVFFRLNSRSPKDMCWPLELPLTCSGKVMMGTLRQSERMLDDLARFAHAPLRPKLCLREFWPGVRPNYEFRCFISGGSVLAVAEYANAATRDLWEAPSPEADIELRAAIDVYLVGTVIPRLHIDPVVVDICSPKINEWRLLEINPFGYSDPVGALSYENVMNGVPSIARLARCPPTLRG